MRKKVLLVAILLCVAALLSAQDYRIVDFALDINVGLDNSYAITQNLVFDFSGPHHGYYQEIPIRFGKTRVSLENLSSSSPMTIDNTSADYITFRVGDSDKTVSGIQKYALSYDYTIGKDDTKEYDEIYLNVLGTGWECAIDTFRFTMHLPFSVDASKVYLTYGTQGSTAQTKATVSADGRTVSGQRTNLGFGKGMTLRIELPEGTFSEAVAKKDATPLFVILSIVLGVVALALSILVYQRYGRDKMLVPVVRFTPPEGLTPMEVGYLADGSVDPKDLTSMLFYWADKGYLTIREEEKKGRYTFTKVKDIQDCKPYEKRFFDAFFGCGVDGIVQLSDLDDASFSRTLEKTKSDVRNFFKGDHDLIDQTAESKRIIVYLLALVPLLLAAIGGTYVYLSETTIFVLLFGLGGMFLSNMVFAHMIKVAPMKGRSNRIFSFLLLIAINSVVFVCTYFWFYDFGLTTMQSILASIASSALPSAIACLGVLTGKRSDYGVKVLEETLGYREFISKVEMDKLKMMIDQDPDIFYHVLGYAIVLGLEDKWAKKFEGFAMVRPSWYTGPGDPMFNYWMFSRMTRGIQSSVMSNLYKEAASGPKGGVHSFSGFSGSTGGGFGGGGGGAW